MIQRSTTIKKGKTIHAPPMIMTGFATFSQSLLATLHGASISSNRLKIVSAESSRKGEDVAMISEMTWTAIQTVATATKNSKYRYVCMKVEFGLRNVRLPHDISQSSVRTRNY